MLHRELNVREREMLLMIKPTAFRDIVDAVRREVENSRYDARRQLRNLKNENNGNDDNDQRKV